MATETYLLTSGHYQIEVMANLDKVPAKGALIVVSWPKVKDGLPLGGLAQEVFEFGEDLLDRVEIGTIGREKEEPCASGLDRGANGLALVAAEIVENLALDGTE